MIITDSIIYPEEGKYLKNIHSGEVYPGYIIPAKSLTKDDFSEVSEEEYQEYLKQSEEVTDEEALSIITGGESE